MDQPDEIPTAHFIGFAICSNRQRLGIGRSTSYVFITYLAWGIFYSSVNIPYGSMASAISSSPNDKTSLSTFRAMGSALGSAITSYIIPMFMYVGASQKISGNRFFWVVVVCAILGYICYQLTTHMTTERVRTEKKVKKFQWAV